MPTALIVEDDCDQAELASRLVRFRGFDPVVVGSGASAAALTREILPDVVLLDLMLPDVDGFEVCRRIRTDPTTARTPIVMLTALSGAEDRARGFRVGANEYLTKPYGIHDLARAIDAARAWRADLDRNQVVGEVHVELDSVPATLEAVNEFVTGLCRDTPFTPDQVMQVRQLIMELGQNAIEWGNRMSPEKRVDIIYRAFADRVEIVIRDQGTGFNRDKLPHAASPDDPTAHMDVREALGIRDGGFGLMICRGMGDGLRYNEAGNEVTVVKRFDLPLPTSERGPAGPDASEARQAP